MGGSDTANIIWYVAVLVLVGSALLSRRIKLRSAVGMILAWIVIFAIVATLFSYREEVTGVARRVGADIMGKPRQTVEGGSLRVAMSSDGHYWVDGTVNDVPARFLIDSGATVTALSAATAKAARLEIDTQRMPLVLNTANGTVEVQRAVATEIKVGSIKASDLPVVVSPAFGDVNVIGMNLLSQLNSWRVENRQMVLEP
ncbi:MAG: retropepsin-like aspartic protease family protein [Sphingobium sp.]